MDFPLEQDQESGQVEARYITTLMSKYHSKYCFMFDLSFPKSTKIDRLYANTGNHTLMLVYHCHKPVFTPKISIFLKAGMREGGLPLPLTFQYLIFMI